MPALAAVRECWPKRAVEPISSRVFGGSGAALLTFLLTHFVSYFDNALVSRAVSSSLSAGAWTQTM
jgi:hypothetical protein